MSNSGSFGFTCSDFGMPKKQGSRKEREILHKKRKTYISPILFLLFPLTVLDFKVEVYLCFAI